MAIEVFATNVDFKQNQLLNPVIHTDIKFPLNPKEGQLFYLNKNYYSFTGKTLYYYDGLNWIPWGNGSSSGSVTSVGLDTDDISVFSVTNSPITSSGIINFSLNSQSANLFLASPDGSTGIPVFRSMVYSDLPDLSSYYIKNQNSSLQAGIFWINNGKFTQYIELSSYTPGSTTNKLYNNAGVLTWNGIPLLTTYNSFLNIANYTGTTQFSASGPTDTLRFEAGSGLTVAFDNTTKKITYGIDTLPSSSVKEVYYFEYSFPEVVSNTVQYFYSWSKTSSTGVFIRSGNNAGIQNDNTIVPIVAPFTGTIKKAILQIRGAGVQNGSVTYPCYLQTEIWKVGYTTEGTFTSLDFPIPNTYTVATFAPGSTNALIEKTGLTISVTKGDMLALKFQHSIATYGAASTVGHIKNVYVTLVMEEL